MMEEKIIVRKKGGITIPVKIREKAKIDEGDVLIAEYKNDKLIFTPYKIK